MPRLVILLGLLVTIIPALDLAVASLPASQADEEVAARNQAVLDKLKRKVTFDFVDTPLSDVVMFLQSFGDLNIVVDKGGLERTGIKKEPLVTLKLSDVTIEAALKFIAEEWGLSFGARDGVLVISDEEGIRGPEYPPIADRVVAEKLQTKVTLHFVKTPLAEAVQFLGSRGDFKVVIDKEGLERAGFEFEDEPLVTLKLSDVTSETALKFMTEQLGLAFAAKGGLVFISDAEGAKGSVYTLFSSYLAWYDVGDLLVEHPAIPGYTSKEIIKVVRDAVDPESWKYPHTRIYFLPPRSLFVRQTSSRHEKIRELLESMREAPQVSIQTKIFWLDNQEYEKMADELNNRWKKKPLGAPGGLEVYTTFDPPEEVINWLEKAARQERIQVIHVPTLTCYNNQEASPHLGVGQQSYDWYEEQEVVLENGRKVSATVTVRKTIDEGITYEVRPVVSADRKYVMLALKVGIVNVYGWHKEPTPVGELDAPLVSRSKIGCNLNVPDRSPLLIGGLKTTTILGERNLVLLITPTIVIEEWGWIEIIK